VSAVAVGYRDYYEVLGVDRDASPDEIQRTYRRLARRYHPDVNKDPEAESRFKEISEAYEVLRDPEKRARYDRLGEGWKRGEDMSGAPGFDEAFGRGGGFGDVRVEFGAGQFSEFFDSLFGARRGANGRAATGVDGFATRGADQEVELELSLEEAVAGGKRRISLSDGREYEVIIPVGVLDGQRIRLAGEGGAGLGNGPRGDLFVRVQIRPHPRFRVDARDVYVDLPVTPWEAVLGAEVQVRTLRGTARARVPAGSSTGRKLRLRGEGLPNPNGASGDLYATLRIVVPRHPTAEERQLFERLAEVSEFNPRRRR
jgi:curved DNA-binding protein